MFFPDLGEYSYYTTRAFPRVKAVGWLDDVHPFETGPIDPMLKEKLKILMLGNERINVHVSPIRGVHPCNLCGADDFYESELRIGSTEIWIPDGQGGFYASPSMIFHYITEHQYLPQVQFIDAIEGFDLHSGFNAQMQYEKLAAEVMCM